jgi:hypothetical protein
VKSDQFAFVAKGIDDACIMPVKRERAKAACRELMPGMTRSASAKVGDNGLAS